MGLIALVASVIAVLFIFSFIVIIHELGHFITAKRSGIAVDEFGVGFPPKIFGINYKGTIYSVNFFPIGGFVKIKGETGHSTAQDSFVNKPVKTQAKVLLAGVMMNLLLAYVILTALIITGIPNILPIKLPTFGHYHPVTTGISHLAVTQVGAFTPADKTAIKVGDWIISAQGQTFATTRQLQDFTKAHAGQSVTFHLKTEGQLQDKTIQLNTTDNGGYLGVSTLPQSSSKYSWFVAPLASLVVLVKLVGATFVAFGKLIVSLVFHAKVTESVTGPIGITAILTQLQKFGGAYVFTLIASISLSLAVVNALPIPALDGGRLFVILLRRTGLKVTPRFEQVAHIVGFAVLVALIIMISLKDIARLRG